jgi:hypothetical protein
LSPETLKAKDPSPKVVPSLHSVGWGSAIQGEYDGKNQPDTKKERSQP